MPSIPWTTVGLVCVACLGMLFFSLAFLVDWIRNWQRVKVYWAYGVAAGLALMAFDMLTIALLLADVLRRVPNSWVLAVVILLIGWMIDVVAATRIAGSTMLGMHYAAEIGQPSFPLLMRWFGARRAPATAGAPLAVAGAVPAVDAGATPPASESVAPHADAGPIAGTTGSSASLAESGSLTAAPAPGTLGSQALPAGGAGAGHGATFQPPHATSLRQTALSVLAVAAAAVTYSVVLFRLTSPHMSQWLQGIPGFTIEGAETFSLAGLALALGAAFGEEIFFRLGIQGFLARYLRWMGGRYWLAIGLSSALWTLGHAGVIEPGWVKLAQIFPIGLMLGWLYRRCGVESCMVAHALFNVTLLPLSPLLIR